MAGKVILISGAGILGILAVLFALPYIQVSHTGDITCGSECVSYFNVTSRYKVCFNDSGMVQTSPPVETELYVLYYGKWKTFNYSSQCIAANSKKQFKLVGYKEPEQTVIWGVEAVGIRQ